MLHCNVFPLQEETDLGDDSELKEDVDGDEEGGVKEKKPVESKLDKRLQVGVVN